MNAYPGNKRTGYEELQQRREYFVLHALQLRGCFFFKKNISRNLKDTALSVPLVVVIP